LSCGFFCLLLSSIFFLAYSQPSQIGCLPYFHTWCGLSANLGCGSETCCMRLARNARRTKSSKFRHLGTTLSGYVFTTKARINNRKKNLLNSNISSTCPHNMANFGTVTAQIDLPVSGTPPNFNGLRVLASLLQRRTTKLCTIFGRLLGWYTIYIHFWALLLPDGILPGAKLTLRPSLALSYIGNGTVRHSSSRPRANFAAWYKE